MRRDLPYWDRGRNVCVCLHVTPTHGGDVSSSEYNAPATTRRWPPPCLSLSALSAPFRAHFTGRHQGLCPDWKDARVVNWNLFFCSALACQAAAGALYPHHTHFF